MNNIIVSAKYITKSFTKVDGQRLDILKGLSLDIEKEKISIIVGASGAGKSTLLHILSGLDNPDNGSVTINDIEISNLGDNALSKFRNKNIGFVFQFHHLLPEFSAVENVAIPMMINGIKLNSAISQSEELLELVGLKERLHNKPSELSGGEQQRVAVARALANKPSIIFADEPTGNLDSANSELIHSLFIDLNKKLKLTFLIVTHNPDLIKLGVKVFEMKDGLLVSK